jgi:hypothetical protein
LKDRDEGIGAILGQVLNFPDICHPAYFPKDKYVYSSPEQNKDAPILNTEAAHWFWGKFFFMCCLSNSLFIADTVSYQTNTPHIMEQSPMQARS